MLVPEVVDPRSGSALDPDVIARLQRLGGGDLVGKLASLFLELAPKRLDAAHSGLRAADTDALRRAAHSLKSSAGNVGAYAVYGAADRLEAAAEGGAEQGTLRSLLDALTTAYEAAAPELRILAESREGSRE